VRLDLRWLDAGACSAAANEKAGILTTELVGQRTGVSERYILPTFPTIFNP
jgi:hypothetical protein